MECMNLCSITAPVQRPLPDPGEERTNPVPTLTCPALSSPLHPAPQPCSPPQPSPLITVYFASRRHSAAVPGDRLWCLPFVRPLHGFDMPLPTLEAQAPLHS